MKKLLLSLLILLFGNILYSQSITINNFSRLESLGSVPVELRYIAMNLNSDGSKPKDKLEIQTNANIKQLVLEGKILYGDRVTKYLENILDRLLINEPSLRKEIKIYAIKSSEVNAFMTPNGFLFFTLGFISQSTCEAELAYVISHELIHYTKKHSYQLKDKGSGESFPNIEDYLKYHSRSRDNEFECDRLGFENYFKNSGYAYSAVGSMYDILQYSYLPFDEVKLNRGIFESEYYKLDSSYFLDNITPISSREDYIDTFSTHPNLQSRRLEMEKLIKGNKTCKGQKFIQPKEEFDFIRTIARFQTINQQIIADNYIKSLYNSLILEKEYPNNEFLLTAQIASLYGLSKVKTYGNYSLYQLTKKNTEGQMQFLANFFEKISKKEALLLALRYSWNGIKHLENKKYFTSLFQDLINDLSDEMNMGSLNLFSDYKMGEEIVTDNDDEVNSNDNNSTKYDKVKKKRLVGHQPKFRAENYMLGDLKKYEDFVREFEIAISSNEAKKAKKLIYDLSEKKSEKSNKILVFEPIAVKIGKDNKANSKPYLSKRLSKQIKNITNICNIDAKIIYANDYDTTISYQTRSRLHEFSNGLNRFGQVYYENRDIEKLKDDIGTKYINLVAFKKKSDGRKYASFKYLFTGLSIPLYPISPLGLIIWLPIDNNGVLSSMIYDIEENQYISSIRYSLDYETSSAFEKEALYKTYKNDKNSIGHLGKRFMVGFDARLNPTWRYPNHNGEKGFFKFDYVFSPYIEYVLTNAWAVGCGYQFYDTKFEHDYQPIISFDKNNNIGDVSIKGFSIFGKNYISETAPLGYYYKVELDFFHHNSKINVRYNDIPQIIKEEKGSEWASGIRIEFGKNHFINNYIYLAWGFSSGILFNGWTGLLNMKDERPLASDYSSAKILRDYFFGLNVSIGFLPF